MHVSLPLYIKSLDHEGRGVAQQADGKTIFIEGALPFEYVHQRTLKNKAHYAIGEVRTIVSESFMRQKPRCMHFGVCGGCSMQHVEASAQVAIKQRILEDNLQRIAKVRAETILPILDGPLWHYRQRARMAGYWCAQSQSFLLGFHAKKSNLVTEINSCDILPQHVSDLIMPLRKLLARLSIKERIPQVEVAVGDHVMVLVLRVLSTPSEKDLQKIREFFACYSSQTHPIQCWLQPKGPDSCYPFYPMDVPALTYALPEFSLEMPYFPSEFTQVNALMNRALVVRALTLLDPQAGERILDLFCGIGNFTLPIARCGATVIGIEGSHAFLQRAQQNAQHNQLEQWVHYQERNLFEVTAEELKHWGRMDRWLIDPPRDGAMALVKALTPEIMPQRIVYVSCNPATLARDAGILVHEKGYLLKAAGIVNMFPHTAHVESVAWFEQEKRLQ